MTLDSRGLERAIVRHCSPTLAGMKPGCLFNVPGAFAMDPCERPASRLASWRAVQQRCEELDGAVGASAGRLRPSGVEVRVMARRPCGALVFVYRPDLLARALLGRHVRARLAAWGYELGGTGWLERAVAHLGSRLEACHRRDPGAAFPHESGFFLGYPYADVMGFIEHGGRDFLCCGSWKVYADKGRALACFERYRRCTEAYTRLFDIGAELADLALLRVGEPAA